MITFRIALKTRQEKIKISNIVEKIYVVWRKSTVNQLSNFGLIEGSMELSGILLAITIPTRKYNKRILA